MPSRRHHARVTIAVAAIVLVLLPAGGCYRHVVEVRGGPSNVPVHEPNIGKNESIWSNPEPTPRPRPEAIETTGFPGRMP